MSPTSPLIYSSFSVSCFLQFICLKKKPSLFVLLVGWILLIALLYCLIFLLLLFPNWHIYRFAQILVWLVSFWIAICHRRWCVVPLGGTYGLALALFCGISSHWWWLPRSNDPLRGCVCVWLFVTPWTVAHQACLSMGFPRQEYWSRLPYPTPGDLPNPRMEPVSLESPVGRFVTILPHGKSLGSYKMMIS